MFFILSLCLVFCVCVNRFCLFIFDLVFFFCLFVVLGGVFKMGGGLKSFKRVRFYESDLEEISD